MSAFSNGREKKDFISSHKVIFYNFSPAAVYNWIIMYY